jgi:hypothetical protein
MILFCIPRSTILDDKKENFVSIIFHICVIESKVSIDLRSSTSTIQEGKMQDSKL